MKQNEDEPKVDRRIQRTQQLLRDALIALILEKGYDAITIQDILDRANMGRSTFYAHYRDKEDLLVSGFQSLLITFQREYSKSAQSGTASSQAVKDLSLFFFRHAGSHQGLFKAMVGSQGGKIVQNHLLTYVTQMIRDHLEEQRSNQHDSVSSNLLAHYIASSYLSLLSWWLDHDMPYPPEQMNRLFQQLVFPGVRDMLTSTSERKGGQAFFPS